MPTSVAANSPASRTGQQGDIAVSCVILSWKRLRLANCHSDERLSCNAGAKLVQLARILLPRTVLRKRFFVDGGFFQDMIHSGINAYLTLHIVQVMLRAGDPQWFGLVQTVAGLASPTGQWPEAIHPRARGGYMGDGHHVSAAAEWVMALRNAIVREEADRLLLASEITPAWLADGQAIEFGPAPTAWGSLAVRAV